jgi:hypothetical protein
VAACSIMRGIEHRAHCARERVCADKAVGVMRVEVSVAITATRNSSGRAVSFCVREKLSAAISVRFSVF